MIATHPCSELTAARKLVRGRVLHRLAISGILALILLHGVANAALADQVVAYHVQDGDTLLSLANRFKVESDEIATVNGLTDPDILVIGQTLMFREPSAANPFGLAIPDRRQDVVESVQLTLEPAAAQAGLVEDPPLPPSLLKMIATIGPVTALERWTPAPTHPAIMPAPIYSQFDGSIWSASNCGPTALSMALGAIGISADQITLRNLVNAQMGAFDPNGGASWESLAAAAQASGAGTKGLIGANGYRSWAIDDLKRELKLGHPVLLLVRYRLVPDHADSSFYGDHYIVALGFDQQGNLVYNDPAGNVAHGVRRRLTPAELNDAWSNTWAGQVHTAMALYK